MKLFPIAGWAALLICVAYVAKGYGTEWKLGPQFYMPKALLKDANHFADGEPLDFLTAAAVRSGHEEEIWLGILAVNGLIVLVLVREMRKTRRMIKPVGHALDAGLMMWNRNDSFKRRDLLSGGVLVFGRPGSGKTSASGMTMARAIITDSLSTMLILCAKPEDKEMWQKIFAAKGRELLVVEPGGLRCNMIDFIQRCGGDTREIVSFILTATEVLRGESGGGGGEYGSFFQDEEMRFLYHAVEVLRQAGVTVSAPNIQRFVSGAALSQEQLNSEQWREGFHNGCLRASGKGEKTEQQRHDLEMANSAWIHEWPVMAQRTRSCVLAGLLNKLFYFNTGIARELISTTTNCSPVDMLHGGKSILVNCPSSEYGDSGVLVSTCWKYLTQKAVLGRQFKEGDFYNIIWADEAWQVTTSFDQHYAATSRSHGGAMVYLAQSRDSFYSALKGEDGRNFSNALIGMFHTKVFHSLGSAEDAEYAASLLGRQRETSFGGSMQPSGDAFDAVMGNSQFSGSFSEAYQPVLQPRVFMSDLRCGGPENEYLADAIIVRSGEPFKSSSQNWIHATFSQK